MLLLRFDHSLQLAVAKKVNAALLHRALEPLAENGSSCNTAQPADISCGPEKLMWVCKAALLTRVSIVESDV